MYRFVVFQQVRADQAATALMSKLSQRLFESDGWRLVSSNDGLKIFDTGGVSGRMDGVPIHRAGEREARGAILGQIFRKDGSSRVDSAFADRVIASGGRSLPDEAWGRYVAFILAEDASSLSIIRAPQGELPCLSISQGGVNVHASYMPDLAALGLSPFTVDWDQVARFMASQRPVPGATALEGVAETPPGVLRRASAAGCENETLWSAERIALDRDEASPADAACRLRASVLDAVSAWSGRYGRVFLNLSGGLDSSIVLAALTRASRRPDINCLNFHSPQIEGDERVYARAMAARAGVRLSEASMSSDDIDLTRIFRVAKGVSPENYLFERPDRYFPQGWVEAQAMEACFYGSGGDNVFFQPHTILGAIDYAASHGWRPGLLSAALDAARLTRRSIWSVLGSVAARPRGAGEASEGSLAGVRNPLISPDVWAALDKASEPSAPSALPPGKRLHIQVATFCPSYYEPKEDGETFMERVSPLFSQPLVETCLRLPTWTLTAGGRDRALARQAFERDLPSVIVNRQSKGGADRMVTNAFDRQRPFLRETLMDGVLANRGMLDRGALDAALTNRDPTIAAGSVGLLMILCAEAWARRWTDR